MYNMTYTSIDKVDDIVRRTFLNVVDNAKSNFMITCSRNETLQHIPTLNIHTSICFNHNKTTYQRILIQKSYRWLLRLCW